MLIETSQIKTNTMRTHLYVRSKTKKTEQNRLIDPENKWVVSRREGGGVVSKIGQRD